jgi:putative two-component system response regulator
MAVQDPPAIVVSDVMMPGRTGDELLKDLKSDPRTRHVPVVLLTARAGVESKVDGLGLGADDYLTKPFHFQELKARIKSLLHQRKLERELHEKSEYLSKLNFDLLLSKKEVFLQTIDALAYAIDAKDPYTHGHSRRVSLLSENLGRQLGLSESECEKIRIAAVLHDIGKIGIPESILQKPSRLTPEEFKIINTHPEIGHRILSTVAELSQVSHCILHHHERFDGNGYPSGLCGHEIPYPSRVIAVCDTYDAMTSDRVYRKGLGHAAAIEEIARCSGKQFDPDCVQKFLRMYEAAPPVYPDFNSVRAQRM